MTSGMENLSRLTMIDAEVLSIATSTENLAEAIIDTSWNEISFCYVVPFQTFLMLNMIMRFGKPPNVAQSV